MNPRIFLRGGGEIWFDSKNKQIKLRTSDLWDIYGGVINPAGSSTEAIYINSDGKAVPVDKTTYIKSGSILQVSNSFLSRRGLWMSELHDSFFMGNKRIFTIELDDESRDLSSLFIHNFENNISLSNDSSHIIKLTGTAQNNYIFNDNLDYGYLVLGFYYTFTPEDVSVRVYCNYESHGIGWHTLSRKTEKEFPAFTNGQFVFYNPYYRCSIIEITIVPKTDTVCKISTIQYFMERPGKQEITWVNKTAGLNTFLGQIQSYGGFVKAGATADQVLLGNGSVKTISNLEVKKADTANSLIWAQFD